MAIKRVKVKSIPIGSEDARRIYYSKTHRPELIKEIKANGIKYPIEIFNLEKAVGEINIHRGCGRLAAADILGIEEVGVLVINETSKKPFGSEREQL
jgi:ParB-like chromosome segregation protein Spo0J